MQVLRSVCVFAIAVSLGTAAEQAKKSALDKPTLEAYVRQVELLPEQLKVTIGDPKPSIFPDFYEVSIEVTSPQGIFPLRYFVSKDGQKIIKGAMFDINKSPFEAEMKKVKTDLQPSFGAPGAPVVIAVFTDFECPNCREEAKVLRDNIQKEFPNEVRVYYKDFPLEQLHPWSRAAAIAGRCVFRSNPAMFWNYHDWIFQHQPEITAENLKDKVLEWAGENKLDTLQLNSCMDTKATEKEIDKSIAEGRSLAVTGTPTLFINGRQLTGAIPWPNLSQIIKREIEYQKTAANAGEKCCEVTIPSLVK